MGPATIRQGGNSMNTSDRMMKYSLEAFREDHYGRDPSPDEVAAIWETLEGVLIAGVELGHVEFHGIDSDGRQVYRRCAR